VGSGGVFSEDTLMKNADQGTECRPDMHVWRRTKAERNSPIAQDRHCVCSGLRFHDLKDGASYLTEYQRSDGTIMSGDIHVKNPH
jgi:hypothetical protein